MLTEKLLRFMMEHAVITDHISTLKLAEKNKHTPVKLVHKHGKTWHELTQMFGESIVEEKNNMKNKPNILIILADQHRYDCLGAYGNKDVKTPNIDSLAGDGITYNNSFCSYPVCTPSRYSMLSGLHVSQHGGWTNHCTLPQHIETFPKVLRENGYRTAAVGKMHFTPTYLDVGFDVMKTCEQNGEGRFDDDYHRELMDKGLYDKIDLMGEVKEHKEKAPNEFWDTLTAMTSNLPENMSSTGWIGTKATEEIDKWDTDGNLLMVGFVKPHHPFDPPKPWCDMYDPDALELLPGWTDTCFDRDIAMNSGFIEHAKNTKAKVLKAMSYYYANISHIDSEVGKMIALLKEKGLYDNTIIIYTSDHGDYIGYHHLMLKGNYMYEPLIKVPLIIKHMNNHKENSKDDALVSNVDIAATLLHLTGVEKPEQMGGCIIGETARDIVVADGWYGSAYMIHDGRYKLLYYKDDSKSQFFDLKTDPFEQKNAYHDITYRAIIDELKKKLMDWALFDSLTPVYCDENGKTIKGDNVVAYDEAKRELSREYFRGKMYKKD